MRTVKTYTLTEALSKLNESRYSDRIRIYLGPATRIGESEQYEIPYEEYRVSTGELVNKGTEDFSIERAIKGLTKYVFEAKSPEGGAPLEIGPLYISRDADEDIIEGAIKNIYDMDDVKIWKRGSVVHPMEIQDEG